jgi:uncharacterized protein YdeI (YjbR/CyaY-like superfamily)
MPRPEDSPDRAQTFVDASAWEVWLEGHHDERDGVWIKIAKKASGVASVTAAEGTEVALCFGWIDGHRKAYDSTHFLQRYSPRRRGSSWSRLNVERAETLIASGRMREAGFTEIEKARLDGRWDAAYESQATATVPSDLAAALAADAAAREAFERLGKTDRYAVILELLKAPTAAARQTRLRRAIVRLRKGPTDRCAPGQGG